MSVRTQRVPYGFSRGVCTRRGYEAGPEGASPGFASLILGPVSVQGAGGGAAELHDARAKLQRAEEFWGQLMAEHDRFLERNPYRMLRELDFTEPHYYVWRAKIVEAPPLERWASITGECVHALRSALDHVAYEIVRVNVPTHEHSEFPIFNERAKWNTSAQGKLPGVDRKVMAQVRWFQPFRRDGDLDPLWLVHTLDITDKHRRLNLVSPFLRRIRYTADAEGDVDHVQPLAGAFADGTPVARFRMQPGRGAILTDFGFDIAFGEGRLAGQPVISTLGGWLAYFGGVVARFDRFFA